MKDELTTIIWSCECSWRGCVLNLTALWW